MIIQGKALGRRKPLFDDFSVPPPGDAGDGGPMTLRDLIAHVVRHEVAAFEQRQDARRLDRVLSAQQIDRDAERGKVAPEARTPGAAVDVEAAVAVALEGFTDGLYLVVIDGDEQRDLDAIVHVTPETRLTFIRLTFLAGA